ncbi:hypothetical protein MKW92_031437 [Papaver armeniacum]|nr:hypothetical protein MKW92_031437 [Papaver armeniacum]
MSSSTTQLVVALILCLLLLGFSYYVEGTARPITASNDQCNINGGSCVNDDESNNKCLPLGCGGGICFGPSASSNPEEKIDVNLFKAELPLVGFYCFR